MALEASDRLIADYGLQLHMGTKVIPFGEMSSGLMKQK
jgi:hypothetical protein